jgi:hypothetical protein
MVRRCFFLVDVTYLYELQVELQGKYKLLSDMLSDVKSFEVKVNLRHKCAISIN